MTDLPTLTAPPTAPSRSDDSDTFDARADSYVAWQALNVQEENGFLQALVEIAAAVNYNTQSTTSVTIGTGAKSFTAETGKLLKAGQFVIAASASAVSNYMAGQVTSYDSTTGTLIVQVSNTGGAGAHADWIIALTPSGNIGSLAAIATSGSGADLAAGTVTLAKISNAAGNSKLLGSGPSGSGAPYIELTLGSGLSITGTTLNVSTGTATVGDGTYGDIIVSGTGSVYTIGAKKVTYSKIQDVSATDMLLGRKSAGSGAVEEIACTGVARTLIAQTTQALMRATGLGLGSIATFNEATTAQFWNNTAGKALSTDKVWAAADLVALTQAATIAVDLATGINFTTTMTGNRVLGNPTNTKNGQGGCIEFVQDGTGGRTLTYGSNWKFPGGTAPVLSTTPGAKDYLFYQVINSAFIVASLQKDVK